MAVSKKVTKKVCHAIMRKFYVAEIGTTDTTYTWDQLDKRFYNLRYDHYRFVKSNRKVKLNETI